MEQLLTMLKVDLGITTTAYDTRLTQYINSAKEMIGTEGVTLNTTDMEDAQLVVMYAGWLWRKRDNGDAMPRMLRWTLNNRLFSEKMNAEG